jgi:Na+/proline symporter
VGVLQRVDFGVVYKDLLTDKPMLVSALLPASLMAIFNNMLFGMGEVFHSNVWWSRVFAMREKVGKQAYLIGGLFWLPVPIAAGFIALASGSLGINITRPDMVGPLVAASVLGKTGSIVVFAVFFCSLASSLDSLLASTADLITQDIYKKMIKPDAPENQVRKVSARIILALGVLGWMVCLPRIGTLADVLFFAGPMVGSTIWPIATGLFWRKANATGALSGMAIGSVVGLIFYFQVGWYAASLAGAAVSMIVVVLFTYLFPGRFDWKQLDETRIVK